MQLYSASSDDTTSSAPQAGRKRDGAQRRCPQRCCSTNTCWQYRHTLAAALLPAPPSAKLAPKRLRQLPSSVHPKPRKREFLKNLKHSRCRKGTCRRVCAQEPTRHATCNVQAAQRAVVRGGEERGAAPAAARPLEPCRPGTGVGGVVVVSVWGARATALRLSVRGQGCVACPALMCGSIRARQVPAPPRTLSACDLGLSHGTENVDAGADARLSKGGAASPQMYS